MTCSICSKTSTSFSACGRSNLSAVRKSASSRACIRPRRLRLHDHDSWHVLRQSTSRMDVRLKLFWPRLLHESYNGAAMHATHTYSFRSSFSAANATPARLPAGYTDPSCATTQRKCHQSSPYELRNMPLYLHIPASSINQPARLDRPPGSWNRTLHKRRRVCHFKHRFSGSELSVVLAIFAT